MAAGPKLRGMHRHEAAPLIFLLIFVNYLSDKLIKMSYTYTIDRGTPNTKTEVRK